MLNTLNIYECCTMCENPMPFKCDECMAVCHVEEQVVKKYIGSGEDAIILEYFQSKENV